MEIKKHYIFQNFIYVVNSLLYVFIFYSYFDLGFETIGYSLAHAFLAGELLFFVMLLNQRLDGLKKISISSLFILVTSLYYMLSSIKYAEHSLYPGFISDNSIRLLGSFTVFIIIIVSVILLKIKSSNQNIVQNNATQLKENYKLNPKVIFIAILLVLTFSVSSYIANPVSPYLQSEIATLTAVDQLKMVFNNIVRSILIVSSLLLYKRKGGKKLFIAYVLLVVFEGITSGSRYDILMPIFQILVGLIFLEVKSMRWLSRYISLVPLGIIILSILIFSTSGRVQISDKTEQIHQFTYRFDLSDYPITLIKNMELNYFSLKPIKEAIYLATPSFLNKNKSAVLEERYDNYSYNKSLRNSDYTDSIFSMGVEIAGLFGFLFLYPIFIGFLEIIDWILNNNKRTLIITKISICYFYIRVEYIWDTLFINLRHLILYFFAVYLFTLFFFNWKNPNRETTGSNIENRLR